ncbi:MAG: peptidoglycan-binding protein [Nocardioides sp.]|uniref:L,D-transpeptidase family protein n=1 Tax=Nocardioides sp. TaxID=35761 RepID=UPI003EFD58B2
MNEPNRASWRRPKRLATLALAPLLAALLVAPLPAGADDEPSAPDTSTTAPTESTPTTTDEPTTQGGEPTDEPAADPAPASTDPTPTDPTPTEPTPTEPTPTEDPGVPLPMKLGDKGEHIRELHSRLHQRGLQYEIISPRFTEESRKTVRAFQKGRGLTVTGRVNRTTWDALVALTREPTYEEMHNIFTPGKALLKRGSKGRSVRGLQARLKQRKLYKVGVDGSYGTKTVAAVKAFQKNRRIPVTGEVDKRTLERLRMVTRKPTTAELFPVKGAPLDSRCTSGRVLCIDKTSRTLRWVVNGTVKQTMDARFGGSSTPTREGKFEVYWKSRDHISSLYGSPMPFAMFFSGGQAVHYSSDFAAVGYNGASHGCVNIRDYNGIKALFDKVAVGDKVVVYWS